MTFSNAVALSVLPNGETRVASSHPWYRWLSAMVDLYLSGYISEDDLEDEATRREQAILESNDVAARRLLGHVFLARDEPETTDYRARLIQILFGA